MKYNISFTKDKLNIRRIVLVKIASDGKKLMLFDDFTAEQRNLSFQYKEPIRGRVLSVAIITSLLIQHRVKTVSKNMLYVKTMNALHLLHVVSNL